MPLIEDWWQVWITNAQFYFIAQFFFTDDVNSILMVVGGFPTNVNNDVEFVDLTDQGRTCRKPDVFPGSIEGSVGTFIDDMALVCGGYPASTG